MRTYAPEEFVRFARMTLARRLQALRRMRQRIGSYRTMARFAQPLDDLIAMHEAALRLRREVNSQEERAAMHAEEARILDPQVDQTVSGLHGMLTTMITAFAADHPLGASARALMDRAFPDGVAAITKLPYVEQHTAVDLLLELFFAEGEVTPEASALGLAPLLAQIRAMNAQYGALLTQPRRAEARQEAKDADDASWARTTMVLTGLLGTAWSDSEEHTAARRDVFEPWVEQEEEAALLRRRRKAARDEDEDEAGLDAEDAAASEDETAA